MFVIQSYMFRFNEPSSGIFLVALRPNVGYSLLILEVYRSHTMTRYSR